MLTITGRAPYEDIDQLLERIDSPQRQRCQRLHDDNRPRFESAYGSRANHQAWPGGYIDHITEVMNFMVSFYAFLSHFGRPLSFSLSEALTVGYIHDLEKPWRIIVDETGKIRNAPQFVNKDDNRFFRAHLLARYSIDLNDRELNAYRYIEGEGAAYSHQGPVSNPLAAFCHMADVQSARGWPEYPKVDGDGWLGASRFRPDQE